MNSRTKKELQKLTEVVEQLAAGTIHMIGLQTAGEVISACQNLRVALDKDETILESK